MYCSNCGMKLPDWANYCERCGTRLRRSEQADDPIERVGLDDSSSMGPLWDDGADDIEPDEPLEQPSGEPSEPANGLAASMDEAAGHAEDAPDGLADDDDANPDSLSAADEPSPEDEDAGESESQEHRQRIESRAGKPRQAEGPQTLAVGEGVPIAVEPALHRPLPNAWQTHPRPSTRYRTEPIVSTKAVALAAAAAISLGLIVAALLFHGLGGSGETGELPAVVTEHVSKKEADRVIRSLDGWWTTDRTYDGRYWHLQDGLMETYAADGQLAKQVLLDASAVEHMSAGPGGIEGSGYFLRDIAYYLLDDDQDTLHAIDADGSAEETANLTRSETPAFVSAGDVPKIQDESDAQQADAGEYMLAESSSRVYTAAELERLSDHDLFVARNEIYARHGYKFEAGELSDYFSSKSWYHPSDVFNEGEITDIERQNVSAILAIEQARGSRYV